MSLFRSRKHSYFLCGGRGHAYLGEAGGPLAHCTLLAEAEGSCADPAVVARLLQEARPSAGGASLALPLHFFQTVNVAIPVMPDEAIGRALPYQLSKAVDKPIGDFVYDWQVSRRQKDHIQLNVYLFPSVLFHDLRKEFAQHQIEVAHLEPEIFAAFAYLDRNHRLADQDAALCAVVWPESLSFAVCEGGRLVLCRSVDLAQPEDGYQPRAELPAGFPATPVVEEEAPPAETPPPAPAASPEGNDSILAGFDIFGLADTPPAPPAVEAAGPTDLLLELQKELGTAELPPAPPPPSVSSPWEEYLDHITLETLRTRDFYSTIIKGRTIRSYFLLGAEAFLDPLRASLKKSIGEDIAPVCDPSGDDSPLVLAIGTGAAAR